MVQLIQVFSQPYFLAGYTHSHDQQGGPALIDLVYSDWVLRFGKVSMVITIDIEPLEFFLSMVCRPFNDTWLASQEKNSVAFFLAVLQYFGNEIRAVHIFP